MQTEMLSRFFSRAEFEKSATATRLGIRNRMTATQLANARQTCRVLADPLRVLVGPLSTNSGFRGAAPNAAVPGSSKTSDHRRGRAIDVETALLPGQGGLSTRELFDAARLLGLPFDQIILEFPGTDPRAGWVHLGYRGQASRGQVLKATSAGYAGFSAKPVHTDDLKAVVAAFQKEHGLTGKDVDGLIGPQTRRLVGQVLATLPLP